MRENVCRESEKLDVHLFFCETLDLGGVGHQQAKKICWDLLEPQRSQCPSAGRYLLPETSKLWDGIWVSALLTGSFSRGCCSHWSIPAHLDDQGPCSSGELSGIASVSCIYAIPSSSLGM